MGIPGKISKYFKNSAFVVLLVALLVILAENTNLIRNKKDVSQSLAATKIVSPGQSIQNVANTANPGDIIQIRAGTYYESVTVTRSGTASAPIKIMGYPGERPVIDGQNSRSTGISIRGSNIAVSNIKVTNHTGHDIDIDASSNSVLENCEVFITGRAIHIQNSNNVTVRNCTITTPTFLAKQTDGIYSQRNKNNVYENNYIVIYNTHTEGHDDAIQMYLDDSMTVRNNYLAQVNSKRGNAQGLYATTMHGVSKFYNNVVNLGNAQSNALSFQRLPQLGGTGSVEIVGNTVYGIRPFHGIWVEGVENPVVKNNISYTPNGVAFTLSGSNTNVSNNLTVDPRFVSINNNDFHLQIGSPAIDKGTALATPYNVDKDGRSRPQGSAWDIGAYEYGSGGPVNTPTTQPGNQKPGDCDGDGFVDLFDYGYLSRSFGLTQGQPGFDGRCDFHQDQFNIIDLFDYQILANNFGR